MLNRIGSSPRVATLIAVAVAGPAILYLAWRSLIAPLPEVDFRYFWLAGHLWGRGVNPYGPLFHKLGAAVLPADRPVLAWVYPPNWWLPSRLLALLPLDMAVPVWRAASSLMLAGGAALAARTVFARESAKRRVLLTGLFCLFAGMMEPTAQVIALAQSTPLAFFGLALVIVGEWRGRNAVVAAGLVLLALKPQLGAGFFLFYLVAPHRRGAAAGALLIVVLMTLPHLLGYDMAETIAGLRKGVRLWAINKHNDPATLNGLVPQLARIGLPLPGAIEAVFVALVAIAGGIAAHNRERRMDAFAVATTGIVALTPLHTYDLSILALAAMLALASARTVFGGLIVAGAMILCLRPGWVERAAGTPVWPGATLLFVAGLLLWGVTLWRLAARRDS